MQISLLDYVLNEQQVQPSSRKYKRRNLTVETISYQTSPKNDTINNQSEMQFYLESQTHREQWVSMELFRNVIRKLDDRLNEYERRLENKEKLEHFNHKLVKLKQQPRNYKEETTIKSEQQSLDESQFQSMNRSKTAVNFQVQKKVKEPEEPLINRLNLFEKRVTGLDEKIQKQIKHNNQFTQDIELKLKESLKQIDQNLEKFNMQSKDLLNKVMEVTNNHRDFSQHLLSLKDSVSYGKATCDQFNEQSEYRLSNLETGLNIVQNYISNHEAEFKVYKQCVMQIEQDLLVILQNYKSVLQYIFKS